MSASDTLEEYTWGRTSSKTWCSFCRKSSSSISGCSAGRDVSPSCTPRDARSAERGGRGAATGTGGRGPREDGERGADGGRGGGRTHLARGVDERGPLEAGQEAAEEVGVELGVAQLDGDVLETERKVVGRAAFCVAREEVVRYEADHGR